jgi:RNA-directed DNA polymerase
MSAPTYAKEERQCRPCPHGKKRFNNERRRYPQKRRTRLLKAKAMKRLNNLFDKISSIENLQLADKIARKGKSGQYGIKSHDKNREQNILLLHSMLINKTFCTSPYTTFKIYEPKEREIFRLPYFPDRIVHHAVMNILEPIFITCFTSNTYSCIKGKGIHAAANDVKIALKDFHHTMYCLKLDIKKFYPNVDHDILKKLLQRKFKDQNLLWLLFEIIDSAPGVPIGNYLSQYFANFYLTYFDHWLKEVMRVKYYFRYADDLVILSGSKSYLHHLLADIRTYLADNLKLSVKQNYQVFPVDARSIDFVGYRFYHTHTLLRKSIKKNFARMVYKNKNHASLASYYGWAKHCNSNHLLKTLLHEAV